MNCDSFNDRLPEYMDGALSAAEQAVASEHVQKCGDCRQALARQDAFAKSVRLSFDRETQGLSLRPETRQNILNALEPGRVRPSTWEYIRASISIVWRQPAWSGAILFCLLLIISGSHFYRRPMKNSAMGGRNDYVIDVPLQTEMHIYRGQNNMVVDALVTVTSVFDVGFSENIRPPTSSKARIN
jgi:hypothetical protein